MSERPGALTQEFAPEVDLPQAEAPVRERPSRGITRSSVGWFVAGAVLIIWCIWAFVDDGTLFVALLGAGLAKGAIVSLAALGFVMIMKATGIANFAQGDLITLGAFLGLWATEQTWLGRRRARSLARRRLPAHARAHVRARRRHRTGRLRAAPQAQSRHPRRRDRDARRRHHHPYASSRSGRGATPGSSRAGSTSAASLEDFALLHRRRADDQHRLPRHRRRGDLRPTGRDHRGDRDRRACASCGCSRGRASVARSAPSPPIARPHGSTACGRVGCRCCRSGSRRCWPVSPGCSSARSAASTSRSASRTCCSASPPRCSAGFGSIGGVVVGGVLIGLTEELFGGQMLPLLVEKLGMTLRRAAVPVGVPVHPDARGDRHQAAGPVRAADRRDGRERAHRQRHECSANSPVGAPARHAGLPVPVARHLRRCS